MKTTNRCWLNCWLNCWLKTGWLDCFQTSVASYIRLFEPLVIRALKQYTVSSCLQLQTHVLQLLAQLVQLRVNYCLLDSDQVRTERGSATAAGPVSTAAGLVSTADGPVSTAAGPVSAAAGQLLPARLRPGEDGASECHSCWPS